MEQGTEVSASFTLRSKLRGDQELPWMGGREGFSSPSPLNGGTGVDWKGVGGVL